MKATHFKVSYRGSYDGRPYFWEETVSADEYQCKNAFWLKLMAKEKREIIEQINEAEVGQSFVWEYEGDRMELVGTC